MSRLSSNPKSAVRPASRSAAPGALATVLVLTVAAGCGSSHALSTDGGTDAGIDAGPPGTPVTISTVNRVARTTTWSVNYWTWMPDYVDAVTGTETLVNALKPTIMRVGGYNNDANKPDPFDDAAFDKAVTYARAIGAEPLIQVPHLADINGQPPTPQTAADMVTYANVTKKYGIKYFAVGNEPDIYPTQGGLTDMTQPAIPNYTPAEFCTSATAYVAAMKAVDPTIQIVGPDLAYRYQAGGGDNDWLTPILMGCGSLFDIIAIHRYPFAHAQASLSAAEADPAAFKQVIASVRGILQATGFGDKPLALTEMNDVYDATTCFLGASPGTVGSGLWLADSLGAAIELGLWTSAVWDISDPDGESLGLIGSPPAHTPRPEYYAYELFADHYGTTVLDAPTGTPSGVSLHASRNATNDTTQIVAVNWNATPAKLAFQVAGLAKTPATATFSLPAVSIGAVEIPDTGPAKAWSYAEAQRLTASAPQPLALGGGPAPATDAGTATGPAGSAVGMGCAAADAGIICPEFTATSPVITAAGVLTAGVLYFGSGSDKWGSFTYATQAPTPPTVALTSDGNGIQITGGSLGTNDYEGAGVYYDSSSCLNTAAYTGVKFDFAGTLGGCQLKVGLNSSDDVPPINDPNRGGCTAAAASCYGPLANVTSAALAATTASPTVQVPFSSMNGGSPTATFDPTKLISLQWQLIAVSNADGGACQASFSVENVSFY